MDRAVWPVIDEGSIKQPPLYPQTRGNYENQLRTVFGSWLIQNQVMPVATKSRVNAQALMIASFIQIGQGKQTTKKGSFPTFLDGIKKLRIAHG